MKILQGTTHGGNYELDFDPRSVIAETTSRAVT